MNAQNHIFFVRCEWDDEAKVWYVAESDVPGLAGEAATVDEMIARLKALVPEMLCENGVIKPDDGPPEIPFQMLLGHLKSNHASC